MSLVLSPFGPLFPFAPRERLGVLQPGGGGLRFTGRRILVAVCYDRETFGARNKSSHRAVLISSIGESLNCCGNHGADRSHSLRFETFHIRPKRT